MPSESRDHDGRSRFSGWARRGTGSRVDYVYGLIIAAYVLGSVPVVEFYVRSADHGYQLMYGSQILQGKLPSIDLVTAAGPLVGLTSAAGLAFNYSLLPETLICAFAYVVSVFLLYRLVSVLVADSGLPPAVGGGAAIVVSLWFLPRFYKWYYWLFPLAVTAILWRAFADERGCPARRRPVWAGIAGLAAGIGALYRAELGVANLIAVCALVGLFAVDRRDAQLGVKCTCAAMAGFLVPVGSWLIALVSLGGSVTEFVLAYVDGARDTVETMRLALPAFSMRDLLSQAMGIRLAILLAALTYGSIIVYAAVRALSARASVSRQAMRLAVPATVGLGILPQSLHRVDVGHVLQIAAPFFALNVACWFLLWNGGRGKNEKGRLLRRSLAVIYVGLSLWMYAGLGERLQRDYESFGKDIVRRYVLLTRNLDYYAESVEPERRREEYALKAVRAALVVRRLCPPDRHILVLGAPPAGYYFDRPVAGIFCYYYPGIYEAEPWASRDMEAILANPPAVVVLDRLGPDGSHSVTRYDAYLAEHYRSWDSADLQDLPYRFMVPKAGEGGIDATPPDAE